MLRTTYLQVESPESFYGREVNSEQMSREGQAFQHLEDEMNRVLNDCRSSANLTDRPLSIADATRQVVRGAI